MIRVRRRRGAPQGVYLRRHLRSPERGQDIAVVHGVTPGTTGL